MTTVPEKKDKFANKVGRPKGYNKVSMLAKMEAKALTAVESGRIRHPIMVMMDYMDSLDKSGDLKAAAIFAKELLPFFSGKVGNITAEDQKKAQPLEVTITRFDQGQTITVGNSTALSYDPTDDEDEFMPDIEDT